MRTSPRSSDGVMRERKCGQAQRRLCSVEQGLGDGTPARESHPATAGAGGLGRSPPGGFRASAALPHLEFGLLASCHHSLWLFIGRGKDSPLGARPGPPLTFRG